MRLLILALLASSPATKALAGATSAAKPSGPRGLPAPLLQTLGTQIRAYRDFKVVDAVETLEFQAGVPRVGDPQAEAAAAAADAYLAVASRLSQAGLQERIHLVQALRVYVGEKNASLLAQAAARLRNDPAGERLLERLQKRYGEVFGGDPKDFGPALEKLFSGANVLGGVTSEETPVPAPSQAAPALPGPSGQAETTKKAPGVMQSPALLPALGLALNAPAEAASASAARSTPEREAVLERLKVDPRFKPLLDLSRRRLLPDSRVFVGGQAFVILQPEQPSSVFKIAHKRVGTEGASTGVDGNEALLQEAATLIALGALGEKGTIPKVKSLGVNANGAVWLELEALPGAAGLHQEPFVSMPLIKKLAILIQAAGFCRGVHEAGWVHGDLKAQNILADAQGKVLLIDFGLATRRGSPPRGGTPGLKPMADRIYDQDSDVYSFGKTLQQLLIQTNEVRPQQARASGLEALIDSMTREDRRQRRPADMAGVILELEAIRRYLEEHPLPPLPLSPHGRHRLQDAGSSLVQGETAKVSGAQPARSSHQEGRRLAARFGVFMDYVDQVVLQQILRTGLHAMVLASRGGHGDEVALSCEALVAEGSLVVQVKHVSGDIPPLKLLSKSWDSNSGPDLSDIEAKGAAEVAYLSATRVVSRLLPRLYPPGLSPPRNPTLTWSAQSRGGIVMELRLPLLAAAQLPPQ